MMILGKNSGGKSKLGGHTAYGSQYRGGSAPTYHRGGMSSQGQQARQIKGNPYVDIFFGIYEEAEEVLELMRASVDKYGFVTVGHLYSVCGIENNHTHHTWGWTDVSRVGIARGTDGYYIDLPNPVAK